MPRRNAASEARDLEVLRRANRRNLRKYERILAAIAKAPDLDEDNIPHDGLMGPDGRPPTWRPRDYQIAKDARKPGKMAPAYIQIAARVVSEGNRLDQHRAEVPNLNVDVQIYVRSDVSEYPVVDLDPVKRR